MPGPQPLKGEHSASRSKQQGNREQRLSAPMSGIELAIASMRALRCCRETLFHQHRSRPAACHDIAPEMNCGSRNAYNDTICESLDKANIRLEVEVCVHVCVCVCVRACLCVCVRVLVCVCATSTLEFKSQACFPKAGVI